MDVDAISRSLPFLSAQIQQHLTTYSHMCSMSSSLHERFGSVTMQNAYYLELWTRSSLQTVLPRTLNADADSRPSVLISTIFFFFRFFPLFLGVAIAS